ncbi:MAG: FAD-dependent oxidoreductase [Candidatus Pacebacteria bacterium]|nr:FAD-dependent oxidoreductase [Candidatus Paceibacterota bacterium]
MLYDLIIIGGGPAGITAGIYAARKKLNVLIIAKDFFGQAGKTGQIDNWPGEMAVSGIALMEKLEKHLRKFPIQIESNKKVVKILKIKEGFSVQVENKAEFQTKALIIATGRSARTLGVKGEQDFLGRGLSYCSICDAPFFKDKQVAVVGGGNAGFEAALDLAKYAKKIFIFEKSQKVLADEMLQEQGKATGKIEILLEKELIKIEGQGKVQAIIYKDIKTQKTFQQPMNGIFVHIGSVPATGFLGKLVDFNKNNEIKVHSKTLQTSQKGIFAAGDCNDLKWKQMIIAAGQGAVAALAVYEYLQNN